MPQRIQQQLDFDRASQLAMLRAVVIPTRPRVVRSSVLKAVLRVIDDHAGGHGWCFATQATIAAELGDDISPRTVRRAIQTLIDRDGLLICERRRIGDGKISINHYRIVWSELAVLARRQREQEDNRADQEDNSDDQQDNRALSRGQPCPLRSALSAPRSAPPKRARVDSPGHQLPSDDSKAWKAAAAELMNCGLSFAASAIEQARQRGLDPLAIESACKTFRAHRSRFRSPGAILTWIRSGAWPVDLPAPPTDYELQSRESTSRRAAADRIAFVAARSFRAAHPNEPLESYLAARDAHVAAILEQTRHPPSPASVP